MIDMKLIMNRWRDALHEMKNTCQNDFSFFDVVEASSSESPSLINLSFVFMELVGLLLCDVLGSMVLEF